MASETEYLERFARSFIRREKRARWLTLLASSAGRQRLVATLDHGYDFDPRWAERIAADLSLGAVVRVLQNAGASQSCYLLSSSSELDGQAMDVAEALQRVFGLGFGTYLVFDPERLAYFESEEPGQRFLLRRAVP